MSDGTSDAYKFLKEKEYREMTESQLKAAEVNRLLEHVNKEQALKQGAKFDSGKPRVDLVPPTLINGVAEILTFGAAKYAAHNWRKGIAYSRIISSLFRHLLAWVAGEQIDPESGKPHLWHVGCNIAFLIEYESKPEIYAKFDDRYKGEGNV